MTRIWNAFKLEFMTAKSVYPLLVVGVIVGILLGLLRRPEVVGLPAMVIGMFGGGTIYQIHSRNHSDKLFGTLPVRRRDVVIGRYLYGFGMALFNMAVGVVLMLLFWKVIHANVLAEGAPTNVTSFTIVSGMIAGWIFYTLAMSISYPLYIRIDYSKAYIFTMLPFMLLIIICVFVIFKVQPTTLMSWFNYLSTHVLIWGICGFGTGLLLIIISCIVSIQLFRTKELA